MGTITPMREKCTAYIERYKAAWGRRKQAEIKHELDRIDDALTQLRIEAAAVEHAAAWGSLDDDRETQVGGAADAAQGAALRRSIEHLEVRRFKLQLEL
jgi:acyl-CoA reductase-like NAD-dependent aldehyde dehydrogenase